MTLYLEAATTIPDLFIDYIEVRLTSGESASLNWYYSTKKTSSFYSLR